MYDRIIVPVEEGPGAESLASVGPLARLLGCPMTVLRVHQVREAPPELEGLTQYRFQHVVESWNERDAEAEVLEAEWVTEVAARIASTDPDMTVSGRVVHGSLTNALRDEAERVLIVAPGAALSEDGPSPLARELIHEGGLPVILTAGDAPLSPIRRILVALDGSHFSAEVLDPVIELARATRARVTLLEVVSRHGGVVRLLHPGERTRESAEGYLQRIADRLAEQLGPIDTTVVESEDPARTIVSEAAREGADLIAMATHGRGGLRRLLLGSVAERVVRECDVPVLVYRPTGSPTKTDPATRSGAIAR